jgi:predicted nucleotidyltransferase
MQTHKPGSLRVAGEHFKLGKTPLLRYVVSRESSMIAPSKAPPPALDEIKSRLAPFCSLARGEIRPDSDIDLLVTFRPDVHPGWDFFGLQDELESLLGCEVDLLTRRSVEQDVNSIRRRSILESTRDLYTA